MKYPGPVSGRGRARGGARRICDSVKCLSSGCHHEVPLTGWLMNNKNLLLTTLEAESPRSGCQQELSPKIHTADFSVSLHGRREARELREVSSKRALIPLMRAPSSWPNHRPPKPHLLAPTHWGWGFQHVNYRGHKHSAHNNKPGLKRRFKVREDGQGERAVKKLQLYSRWETRAWSIGAGNFRNKNRFRKYLAVRRTASRENWIEPWTSRSQHIYDINLMI